MGRYQLAMRSRCDSWGPRDVGHYHTVTEDETEVKDGIEANDVKRVRM